MNTTENIKIYNDMSLTEKAKKIYTEKYKKVFEKQYKGKIVAIEPESGDCFIGDNTKEAYYKAILKHPDKFFHFIKIGYKGVYKRR